MPPETMEETGAAVPPPEEQEHTDEQTTEGAPFIPAEELNAVADALVEEDKLTDDQVRTLAEGLAANAQHFAAAEQAEKAQDADIFSGPYDPAVAVRAIAEINREVVAAKAEWEASKEQTKGFKKTYDEAAARLSRVVSRYDQLRTRSATEQPFLKVVEPDDETVGDYREKLAKELGVHGQLFIDADGLKGCTRQELDILKAWAGVRGPIPPEIVTQKAHIAGAPGHNDTVAENGAYCLRCGGWLGRQADASDYPSEAFVGLDCPGDPAPAKKTRKPRKRHNPEAERAQQSADAQEREQEGDEA